MQTTWVFHCSGHTLALLTHTKTEAHAEGNVAWEEMVLVDKVP